MKRSWPSPPVWAGTAAGLALTATILSAFARTVVFNLTPESYAKSVQRFTAGAPEIEVDPRPRWARIPRILPGPADSWAGNTAHALRFPLGQRPVRPLVLYLHFAQEWAAAAPARLTVTVNGTAVTTVGAPLGTALPSPPADRGARSRHKIRIPATALGDGTNGRLSIVNDSGASVVWERIRLVEARPTLSWVHLARRGPLPPESAAFLAASLGTLLMWSFRSGVGKSLARRILRSTGAAVALILLSIATVIPRASPPLAGIPRWLWLASPWALLILRPRTPGRGVRVVTPRTVDTAAVSRTEPLRRTSPEASRAKSIIINCTLSLVAFAVSLLLAEFALRVALRDVTSAGDTRTYFHHHPHDMFNSFGFREREFTLRKPKNMYRIALVGDSFTIGGPLMARVSNRLEEYLKAKGRPDLIYEVLNFGRTGADTEDEVRLLRTLVLGTHPDFVLLQWYVNDFENHDHSGRPTPFPLVPSPTLHSTLVKSSALYALIDPQWTLLQEKLGLIESHAAYMYRRFGDPEGPGSTYETERLKEFIDQCRRQGTPLGIVLFPRVGPDLVRGAYEYDYLHDRVLEACHDERVTCVDLRTPFAAYTDYKQLWITPLDGHPSPLANQLAAERLIDAFGQIWLGAHLKAQNH